MNDCVSARSEQEESMQNQFKKIPFQMSHPDYPATDGQPPSHENQSQQQPKSHDTRIPPPGPLLPGAGLQELSPQPIINSDPLLPSIDDLLTAQMPSVKLPPSANLLTA